MMSKPISQCAPSPIPSMKARVRRRVPWQPPPSANNENIYTCRRPCSSKAEFPVEKIACLADLVEPGGFKAILLPYHLHANRQANAFVICLAQTLIQVAQYHVVASEEHITLLKRIASKLPSIPHELTPKNKALMRQFESDRLKAKLLFLPEQLVAEVTPTLEKGPLDFVRAQVAIAIDFQLAIPLRPQNLSRLNWGRHFSRTRRPEGTPAPPHSKRRDEVEETGLHGRSPRTCRPTSAVVPTSHPVAPQCRFGRRFICHREGLQEGPKDRRHSNHQNH